MRGQAVPTVLGRLAGTVEPGIRVGERCLVIGWPIAENGRKRIAGAALFAESGALHGRALATWFQVAPEGVSI